MPAQMSDAAVTRYQCEPGLEATLTKVVECEGEERQLYRVRVLNRRQLAVLVDSLWLADVQCHRGNPTAAPPPALVTKLDQLAFAWSTEAHRRKLLSGDIDFRGHYGQF